MKYSFMSNLLSQSFDLTKQSIDIPESKSKLYCFDFKSGSLENSTNFETYKEARETFFGYNSLSFRNLNFKYPAIIPDTDKAKNEVIILLHGLNERSWAKYLPWAYRLSENTGKSVILFPLAYHMNRSPEAWKDPRQMMPFVQSRQKRIRGLMNSSIANVALSERLTSEPEQFFLSGYQSVSDMLQLLKMIKNGNHSQINAGAKVDFFAYSIGAFLAEVLLLSNPENLLENSRIFLFCGGSAFAELNGNSKYILDSRAFRSLLVYYLKNQYITKKKNYLISHLIKDTSFGQAFFNMLSVKNFYRMPMKKLKQFSGQLVAACLLKDEVVPIKGLVRTLKDVPLKIFDFNYGYTHEMPFPVTNSKEQYRVDDAFDKVFDFASMQLA